MNNNSLKILVVVESLDAEGSSGAKANLALINNLIKSGFEIKVIHYTRKQIQIEKVSTTALKENRKSFFFLLSRMEAFIRVHLRLPLNSMLEDRMGFSFTLLNDRNSIKSFLKRINPEEFDFALTLSHGGSFRPHHALLQLPKWHSKWIAYIHDPYPMHHYPPPYTWTEPGSVKKETFVREVSEKAAFSAFPSKVLLEWMTQFYPQFQKTGVVIPHQISQEALSSEDFPEWFKPSNFNIVHAGNLLWGRSPIGLIQGFKSFIKNCPQAKANARLIFIGGKNHYSKMLSEYAQELPGFYTTEKNIPFDTVMAIQNSSSINVILEAKSEISPFLPGKFPHCVAANRPILLLGPPISESRRLLGENYPFWTEIESSNKIAELLGKLYKQWCHNALVKLDRPDLEFYLSKENLKEVIISLNNK